MNFRGVTKIDGLGISTLEYFLSRGIDIRLITVRPTVIAMLRMAMKKDILKRVYTDTDCVKAVSVFEKEKPIKGAIKMRRFPRANTLFHVDLEYLSYSSNVILCNAKALHLSESGLFDRIIKGVELKKKRLSTDWTLLGRNFMTLRLN